MIHLAVASPVVDVGRSVREGAYMFWETLWALVLGFSLAGLVQAFVSKEQMQAKLGNHGPAVVGRAAGYGMVSSSCSYAASAMAKSLFAKGADLVAALIFMSSSASVPLSSSSPSRLSNGPRTASIGARRLPAGARARRASRLIRSSKPADA